MEEDVKLKVNELEARISQLERVHKRQKLFRIVMIVGALLYVVIALFAYGRLLSSISI